MNSFIETKTLSSTPSQYGNIVFLDHLLYLLLDLNMLFSPVARRMKAVRSRKDPGCLGPGETKKGTSKETTDLCIHRILKILTLI